MAFSVQGGEEVMSDINVTPLVDVMLVLVVVFLVTAPLLTNSIRVNLPQTAKTSATTQEAKKEVNVSVNDKGEVFLDKRAVDVSAVEPELKALHTSYPDLAVHLNADKAVNYGLVAKAMAAINRAGVTHLSVLTVGE
jgi:biopolymer transport protein ExbD